MNPQTSQRRFTFHAPRRGAALFALITLMSVTALLASVWARRIVVERRHQRRIEEQVQVQWLVDSGLRRAAAQVAADPAFTQEQWRIPAAELGRAEDALVVLRAEPAEVAGAFNLTVEARYPAADPHVKRSKSLRFSPPATEPAP